MPNLTLAIDPQTAKEMRLHPEIRWSEVARQAIQRKLDELHALEVAFAKSKLTKRDVERIARSVNKGILKRLGH